MERTKRASLEAVALVAAMLVVGIATYGGTIALFLTLGAWRWAN